jgi:hypothetical protein
MTDMQRIAEQYLASWNAVPAQRSRTLSAWSEDATYVDPLMSASGRDAIGSMMDQAVVNFPGHAFVLSGAVDGHGPYVRFNWTLAAPDTKAVAHGTDVVRVDRNGRIADVIGFLN